MISPYWLIDPASILIQSLVIVQREHLGLLLLLLLLLALASSRGLGATLALIVRRLLLQLMLSLGSLTAIVVRWLVIFLVEEREVIRIFSFAVGRV